MHSRFSDGRKSRGRDRPRRRPGRARFHHLHRPRQAQLRTRSTPRGAKSGVLVLAGSELSVSRGHLVALDFERPEPGRVFSQNAENAAGEVRGPGRLHGHRPSVRQDALVLGRAASTTPGSSSSNGDSLIKQTSLSPTWPITRCSSSSRRFALLKMIEPPAAEPRQMGPAPRPPPRPRPILGFYSVDAHFLYAAIFPVFHLHVLLDAPPSADFAAARARIFDALRAAALSTAPSTAPPPPAASASGARAPRSASRPPFLSPTKRLSFTTAA